MMLDLLSVIEEVHQGVARLFDEPYELPGAWRQAYFRSIYALAILSNPDLIIDVGTERGVSTMALALALKTLGKPLGSLVTIDVDHALWKRLPEVHADLLKEHGMDLREVRAITEQFSNVNRPSFSGKKVFIFYDIHDYFKPGWVPSASFITCWLSHIEGGIVLVDNMYRYNPFDPFLEEKMLQLYLPSRREHWSGQCYYGFGECGSIIDWLNEHRGQLFPTDANQAYFLIRGGKPL